MVTVDKIVKMDNTSRLPQAGRSHYLPSIEMLMDRANIWEKFEPSNPSNNEKKLLVFFNFLPRSDACAGLRLCERGALHHVRRRPPQAPGQQYLLRRRQREVRG